MTPPEILFQQPYHNPLPKTNDGISYNLIMEYQQLKYTNYVPEQIKAGQIPEKFRTGIGHPSNVWNMKVDDPADVAGVYYRLACRTTH